MTPRDDGARPAPAVTEPGVPATSEITEAQRRTGGALEEEAPVPERPMGAEEWGTTAAEHAAGEPIAERRRRERPDREGAGRQPGPSLVEPTGDVDDEPDLVGDVDPSADDAQTAEEAAMRIEANPAGLSNTPDPGYVED
jgi:hypothetical protein